MAYQSNSQFGITTGIAATRIGLSVKSVWPKLRMQTLT